MFLVSKWRFCAIHFELAVAEGLWGLFWKHLVDIYQAYIVKELKNMFVWLMTEIGDNGGIKLSQSKMIVVLFNFRRVVLLAWLPGAARPLCSQQQTMWRCWKTNILRSGLPWWAFKTRNWPQKSILLYRHRHYWEPCQTSFIGQNKADTRLTNTEIGQELGQFLFAYPKKKKIPSFEHSAHSSYVPTT